jgi:hypothetical protein
MAGAEGNMMSCNSVYFFHSPGQVFIILLGPECCLNCCSGFDVGDAEVTLMSFSPDPCLASWSSFSISQMLQRAGIQFELVYRFWSLLVLQGQ